MPENVKNLLIETILKSDTFKNAAHAVMRSIASQSHPDVFVLDFVQFAPDEDNDNETDLYYSLQKIGFVVHGTRMRNGRWNKEVTIFDTYNFDEMRPIWGNGFNFGNVANDLGLGMQFTGMMTPYKISASYSVIW